MSVKLKWSITVKTNSKSSGIQLGSEISCEILAMLLILCIWNCHKRATVSSIFQISISGNKMCH